MCVSLGSGRELNTQLVFSKLHQRWKERREGEEDKRQQEEGRKGGPTARADRVHGEGHLQNSLRFEHLLVVAV